jgi:integrase
MNSSELHDRLERYLALRRAVGFQMHAEERLLRDFLAFVEARGSTGPLRAQAAVDWACSTAERCGPGGQARRLGVARGFLSHLRATVPETEVPGPGLLVGGKRRLPHIYSEAEIRALIAAARQLGPRGSLRPHTVATLIGLMASSGLRAGEAMHLRLADVDLEADPARLIVLETKFRKSRLVPIHPSTADALRAYAQERHRLGYDGRSDFFFVSERGGPLNYRVTARTFVALARRLGIRGPHGHHGASLHALRHYFAVRRVTAWYREGVDVDARMHELSTYLGHAELSNTYWYLTATPELLGAAADRFETYASARGAS